MNFGNDVKKSTDIIQPLSIYTKEGCPACSDVKKLCDKNGIKYKSYDRREYSDYVNKNTGNCRYVPNIFNANKEYIGGNEDLIKILKN
jgi:glutaredoxin